MLAGLVVPLPTLFGPKGELDAPKNERFATGLSRTGVDHLFVLGSLGEFPLVSDEERNALVEAVLRARSGATDVWVGCGAPSTDVAVRYARAAEAAGAAAVVAVPPYYLHPTSAAIARYYQAIRRTVGIPLLAYNIPSLVGYPLAPALVHELARGRVIQGIKDTSGSMESVQSFLTGRPDDFEVLPGNDPLASEAIRSGCGGAIMGTANVAPRLARDLVRSARSGDMGTSGRLQALIDRLSRVIGSGPFPSTDKFLASRLRGAEVGYRSPYDPLTPEEERRVLAELGPLESDLAPFLSP